MHAYVFIVLRRYAYSLILFLETFFGFFSSFAVAFRNCVAKLQSKKARGKMLGGGAGDDPMSNIIANIKAGKARKQAGDS